MNLPGLPEVIFISLPLIFFALVILAIAALVKPNRSTSSAEGALQLLEERYARGEITRDEFMERREVLRGGPASS